MAWNSQRLGLAIAVAAAMLAACSGAESRKASFVAQSEKHMAMHDWQKARIDLRNALQIDPKDQKLQFMAALVAERVGDYNEAAGRYQALIDHDKTDVAARAALARLYAGAGVPAEAIRLAEAGLALAPTEPKFLTARGVGRAMSGDTIGALQDAEAAISQLPTDADTAVLIASLYQRKGRSAESLAVLARASAASPDNVELRVVYARALTGANRAGDAEKELLAVVKLEPREIKHRYRLAEFYVLQHNVDAAEKALRDAVAADPEEVDAKLALANFIASQRTFEGGEKSLRDLVATDPGNLTLQLGLGQFYEAHQRVAPAEEIYRKVVATGGTNTQALAARNRLAALALAANRNSDASALIGEVLASNPRDNDALTMRANIALSRGDTTSAIADLRAVLRDQPNAPVLMRALASAYLANHDVGLAEETLRSATRANPTDVQTRLALAEMLMKSGRGDEAQPVADQLLADLPGDVRAIEAAFRIQVQKRDLVGARKSAGRILALRPDLPVGAFLTGLVDEAEGKLDAAREAFEHAGKLAPGFVEPISAAVRVDLTQRQADRALGRIAQALQSAPGSSTLLALKSETLLKLDRFTEAADVAAQATTKSPAWWVAYDDLAKAELGRGRLDVAIAVYQRGLEATQFAPPLAVELGSLLEQRGRVDEAGALYERWLERLPGSEIASNNLAMLLVSHQSKDPASLDRALQLAQRLEKSTQPPLLDTLGWVHYVRGEYPAAIDALQRAVAAAPAAPIFRAHLGLAQFKAGQRDAARENLKAALASDAGDSAELADARAVYAQLQGRR